MRWHQTASYKELPLVRVKFRVAFGPIIFQLYRYFCWKITGHNHCVKHTILTLVQHTDLHIFIHTTFFWVLNK